MLGVRGWTEKQKHLQLFFSSPCRVKRSQEVKGHGVLSVFQYEDLAHYGLDGVGGVYGDHHHHHHHAAAARSLQAVHLAAAAPYPPHQFSQSSHSSDNMAATAGDAKRDKDAIYGYDEFTDLRSLSVLFSEVRLRAEPSRTEPSLSDEVKAAVDREV